MNYRAIFSTGKNALGTDLGLLLLRASFGLSLFLKHGLEKVTSFTQMAQVFPDPLHLGAHVSLRLLPCLTCWRQFCSSLALLLDRRRYLLRVTSASPGFSFITQSSSVPVLITVNSA